MTYFMFKTTAGIIGLFDSKKNTIYTKVKTSSNEIEGITKDYIRFRLKNKLRLNYYGRTTRKDEIITYSSSNISDLLENLPMVNIDTGEVIGETKYNLMEEVLENDRTYYTLIDTYGSHTNVDRKQLNKLFNSNKLVNILSMQDIDDIAVRDERDFAINSKGILHKLNKHDFDILKLSDIMVKAKIVGAGVLTKLNIKNLYIDMPNMMTTKFITDSKIGNLHIPMNLKCSEAFVKCQIDKVIIDMDNVNLCEKLFYACDINSVEIKGDTVNFENMAFAICSINTVGIICNNVNFEKIGFLIKSTENKCIIDLRGCKNIQTNGAIIAEPAYLPDDLNHYSVWALDNSESLASNASIIFNDTQRNRISLMGNLMNWDKDCLDTNNNELYSLYNRLHTKLLKLRVLNESSSNIKKIIEPIIIDYLIDKYEITGLFDMALKLNTTNIAFCGISIEFREPVIVDDVTEQGISELQRRRPWLIDNGGKIYYREGNILYRDEDIIVFGGLVNDLQYILIVPINENIYTKNIEDMDRKNVNDRLMVLNGVFQANEYIEKRNFRILCSGVNLLDEFPNDALRNYLKYSELAKADKIIIDMQVIKILTLSAPENIQFNKDKNIVSMQVSNITYNYNLNNNEFETIIV